MRFQVPQFIEVEDKIFGPLTLKQFIYLVGGGGLSFMVYSLVDSLMIALLPIVAIMALSAALAFFKIHNRPMINVVESAFRYFVGDKLYVWRKTDKPLPTTEQTAIADAKNYATLMVPKISDSKLKDLTWSLDVQDSLYASVKSKLHK